MSSKFDPFIDWFRGSAPYIHAHRGRTFVIVVGGEIVASPDLRHFLHDLALLQSLGVRLVLVAGARPQIDESLGRRNASPHYVNDLRITDTTALECVKEAVGAARVELEALLSMGLPNSPMAGAQVRVASGNFVMAKPVGIVEGVDHQHTGKPRRIDVDAIQQRLDDGAIVILTPLGYSVTGEIFNMSSYEVASAAAVALQADKLIGLVEGSGVVDSDGRLISQLTPAEADEIIAGDHELARDVRGQLAAAAEACRGGVPRAHLVSRHTDGALLKELYTRDGVGTLITGEMFEGIRAATSADVGGILQLIEPLEQAGVLVRRSHEMLENDIERFFVLERDNMVIACAALYPYPDDKMAELACLSTHPSYRDSGRGDTILEYLERHCQKQGLEGLFVLTTQTSHWFRERGFEPCELSELPEARRSLYDKRRGSQVLLKRV